MNKKLIKTFGALAGIGAIASAATISLTSCGGDSLTPKKDQKSEAKVGATPIFVYTVNTKLDNAKLVWEIRKSGVADATFGGSSVVDATTKVITLNVTAKTVLAEANIGKYEIGFSVTKADGQDKIDWKSLATISVIKA